MFKNQNIAVTGAGTPGGIGRAIADMFIAGGANVMISDLEAPMELAEEIGATAFACNVADESAVQAFIQTAESVNGPLDVFVSNAGVGFGDLPAGHAAGASNDAWETSWQVNVMANIYAARALLPGWIERGSGRFVITSSAAGLLNQIGSASYSATKHAALGYAEAMAIAHKDDGIDVHCICPQYVRTNMTKGAKFAEDNKDGLLEPSDVANALKQAITDKDFLVLSHPVVNDYFRAKAMNYNQYIAGMAKLKAKTSKDALPL
ncbi:MAG: SDR family NAD(P)-dependent oxidoreductase [Alphaproteobacteria bacterium]